MTTAPHTVDAALRPGPAQLRLAGLAAPVCVRYGLALAGGHALRAHGVTACTQDGLTLATGGADLPEVADALSEAYRAAGGGVAERPGTPRLEQLTVRLALGGRTHSVELRKEPLGHRPVRLDLGAPGPDEPPVVLPVVALEDAAALTTALLVDRGMPRDLVDVHALTRCYREGELIALAGELDQDLQLAALADRLETLAEAADGRFRARGVPAGEVDGLKRWALAWAQDLRLDLLETQEAADGLHDPYLEESVQDDLSPDDPFSAGAFEGRTREGPSREGRSSEGRSSDGRSSEDEEA